MKPEDLERFKHILLQRREALTGSLNHMQNEALRNTRTESTGDLSSVPIHMADVGSENFEQDLTLGLIESEEEELRQIDAALERIENGTFGICERCGKQIPKARLNAIPYATMCIDCKRAEEEAQR